jgi:hypothetical protein
MKQHPLSAAFPAMSADDFQALKSDIEANGQREPIIVLDGMVLDGWHRYRACTELGTKVKQFTFACGSDPVAFVISHNLHRRHLTASQRAAAVVACQQWQPAGVRTAARVEPSSTHASTNAEMARLAQVTPRTITDAKTAHKAGLGEAVKAGALTAKEAASVARGTPAVVPKAKRHLNPLPADMSAPTSADELAEARDVIASLSEDNDRLRDKLAVESMDAGEEAKSQAAQTIADLRNEVKAVRAELDAVKSSRDGYMRENAQLRRQCELWRKKAEKAGGAQ